MERVRDPDILGLLSIEPGGVRLRTERIIDPEADGLSREFIIVLRIIRSDPTLPVDPCCIL